MSSCSAGFNDNDSATVDGSGTTSDSSLPYVLAINDSNGSLIDESGSIVSESTSFTVIFSKAMDTDSVTSSTLILTCDDEAITGTISASTDNTQFSFTPSAALPETAECTFRVVGSTSGVKDTAGNPLSTYGGLLLSFSVNGCYGSDDFDQSDILTHPFSCYLFANTTNQTNTGSTSNDSASIDTENGELVFDFTTVITNGDSIWKIPTMAKQFSGNLTASITITSITADDVSDNNAASGGLVVYPSPSFADLVSIEMLGEGLFACTYGPRGCVAQTIQGDENDEITDASCLDYPDNSSLPGTFEPNVTLRIIREDDAFTCQKKESGDSDFETVGNTVTIPFSEDTYLMVFGQSNSSSGDPEIRFDNLEIEGTILGADSD